MRGFNLKMVSKLMFVFVFLVGTFVIYPTSSNDQTSAAATSVFDAFLTIKGSKQGLIKGDSMVRGYEKSIEVTDFELNGEIPTDDRNLPNGPLEQRLTITKYVDKATPSLLKAFSTNENVTEFTMTVTKPQGAVSGKKWYELKLRNATISSQKLTVVDGRCMEVLEFDSAQTAEITYDNTIISQGAVSGINSYLKLEGNTQGMIKGASINKDTKDQIAISNFNYSSSIDDIQSRPSYDAIQIDKLIDKSTPLLWNAIKNNETLKMFQLSLLKRQAANLPPSYNKVNLTKAVLISYTITPDSEKLLFGYKKLSYDSGDGNIVDIDLQQP